MRQGSPERQKCGKVGVKLGLGGNAAAISFRDQD